MSLRAQWASWRGDRAWRRDPILCHLHVGIEPVHPSARRPIDRAKIQAVTIRETPILFADPDVTGYIQGVTAPLRSRYASTITRVVEPEDANIKLLYPSRRRR